MELMDDAEKVLASYLDVAFGPMGDASMNNAKRLIEHLRTKGFVIGPAEEDEPIGPPSTDI